MKLSRYKLATISLLFSSFLVTGEDIGIATKHCLTDPPRALQYDTQLQCPPPIDETIGSQAVDWSPWTHRPGCVDAEKDPGLKYCVYSNSRHGYQGISIITKPKTAADSAGMLNEEFPGGHSINTTTPSYAIVDMPLKGKGVVATRKIARAEAFMSDWATVVLDLSFPKVMKQQVGHQYLHLAAEQLSDPDKVLGLGRSSTKAVDIMEDILGTNSFSYTLGGDSHMALYPEVARINHACKPNAFVRFSPTSFDVKVVAFRDIEIGEEITISYIPLNHPREKRQRDLRRWGFECKCSLCTASKTEIAASDYRREKIASLQENVMKAIGELDGTTAVRAAYEILALVEAEDIPTMVAAQYEVLARLFWKAGETETATKYAQKSLDTLIGLGYIDYRADDLSLLLKDFTT
ncbi:putative mannose-6-phosphate isomerase-like protein [Rosellinia necatrix]|uniref:Putative mannose-6-phosphate isomerase-like protein n=1 Tax=Rosellinia necatrix TaxID=77044 RepID=A0A1W2TFZ6_ROSNE|nr:putative mannose-6-phosphate isomerase-like protein [Rosellinia necatrix]